jgi:hypothetical protein
MVFIYKRGFPLKGSLLKRINIIILVDRFYFVCANCQIWVPLNSQTSCIFFISSKALKLRENVDAIPALVELFPVVISQVFTGFGTACANPSNMVGEKKN